jgi:heme/copper-type cytochrome/quinol oxidase subunit 2
MAEKKSVFLKAVIVLVVLVMVILFFMEYRLNYKKDIEKANAPLLK